MPAKLPEELIRKRPRTVADLEPGSEAFVPLYSIVVDLDRSVYLFRNAELESTDEKSQRRTTFPAGRAGRTCIPFRAGSGWPDQRGQPCRFGPSGVSAT